MPEIPEIETICVEFVEGCSLACDFCGIRSIRERPGNYKYIMPETVATLCQKIEEIGQENPINILISGRGEPTLHPNFATLIALLDSCEAIGCIELETHGERLIDPADFEFTVTGLNSMGIDLITINLASSNTAEDYDKKAALIAAFPMPENADEVINGNTYLRDSSVGADGEIINSGGDAGEKVPSMDYPCHLPFTQIFVRYDGKLGVCSFDYGGRTSVNPYTIADIDLEAYWRSDKLNAIRKGIRGGVPISSPCMSCNGANLVGAYDQEVDNWKDYLAHKKVMANYRTIGSLPMTPEYRERDWEAIKTWDKMQEGFRQ